MYEVMDRLLVAIERLETRLDEVAAAVRERGVAPVAPFVSPSPLLTKADAAELLGVSTRKIERMVRGRSLRRVPGMGRVVRFSKAEVERLMFGGRDEQPGRRRL